MVGVAAVGCSDDASRLVLVDGGAVEASSTVAARVEPPTVEGATWIDLGDHADLFVAADMWTVRDPRVVEPTVVASDGHRLVSGAFADDQVFFGTDGGVRSWADGTLIDVPIPLDGELTALFGMGDELWLLTGAELVRYADDTFTGLSVGGHIPTAIVPATSPGAGTAMWARTDALVHLLDDGSGTLVATEAYPAWREQPLVVSVGGQAWLAQGDGLFRRSDVEAWTRFELDDDITQLMGHRLAREVWFEAAGAHWVALDDGFVRVEGLPAGRWRGVDARGRLWVGEPGDYRIASLDRAIGVAGLAPEQRLTQEARVTFDPVEPERVTALHAEVVAAGEDIATSSPLSGPPWRLRVSPDEIGIGPYELALSVEWDDGDKRDLRLPLTVGDTLPPNWADDVGPLYERHCAACHVDGGSSFDLSTPDRWQAQFEAIVEQVSTGEMPLDGDPLSAAQQSLLSAWAEAGFLR